MSKKTSANKSANIPQADTPNTAEVELDNVIPSLGTNKITLRKPCTGDFRGTTIHKVLICDVEEVAVVLKRITSPVLLPEETYKLEVVDFLKLCTKIDELAGKF